MRIRTWVVAASMLATSGCKNVAEIHCGDGTILVGNECVIRAAAASMPPSSAAVSPSTASPAKEPPSRAQPEQRGGTLAAFDSPIVIDGIEVILSKPSLGPLPRTKQDRFISLPDGRFLQFKAHLRNASATAIVVVQDMWKSTILIDEYDNRLPAVGSGMAINMAMAIEPLIPSGHLRPGQAVDGLLIVEPPVDAAKRFRLESDPGFYMAIDNMMIRELSNTSFTLSFTRSDISEQTPASIKR